jgi:hypothetical protein
VRVADDDLLSRVIGIGNHVTQRERQWLASRRPRPHSKELTQESRLALDKAAEHANLAGASSAAVFCHDDFVADDGRINISHS